MSPAWGEGVQCVGMWNGGGGQYGRVHRVGCAGWVVVMQHGMRVGAVFTQGRPSSQRTAPLTHLPPAPTSTHEHAYTLVRHGNRTPGSHSHAQGGPHTAVPAGPPTPLTISRARIVPRWLGATACSREGEGVCLRGGGVWGCQGLAGARAGPGAGRRATRVGWGAGSGAQRSAGVDPSASPGPPAGSAGRRPSSWPGLA